MKKVKVMHLLTSDRFSGAENVVCQIIGMMKAEKNIEMIYCSKDGQIREALSERGITFYPVSQVSVAEIKRVIDEYKPDIIHAHDMRASFIAARACGKIKLISHIHNNAFDSRGISAKSIAYMYAAMKAKHVFWVSDSSFKGYAFHNLFAKKSSVLYNIINIDALYDKMNTDSNSYNYDVVYVGRLSYPKNPQKLMQVLEKVVKAMPDVKIGIAGTGELAEETKKLCKELKLNNNVEFLGFQTNPLKIMHDARVMVMTSRWEGTPMCALEAMALGLPIVSTPTDGLRDLIDNGLNGYLSDNNEELAGKILKILGDNELYKEFSENIKNKCNTICDLKNYKDRLFKQYGI